jgi:hypothetical protein
MPYEEFQRLKRLVNELAGIRATLVELTLSEQPGRALDPTLAEAVKKLLPALKTIREDVQKVLVANSKSWEAGDA